MFFGCWLIAFGPLLAMFLVLYRDKGIQIIIMIGSSFFWLLAALIASLFWLASYSLLQALSSDWSSGVAGLSLSLTVTVALQEGARWAFWKLYKRAERGLSTTNDAQLARIEYLQTAGAVGLGSGAAHSLITYATILWDAQGPGALFSKACPGVSLFLLSAIYALFFSIFHVFSSFIAFDAYEKQSSFWIGAIGIAHLALSYFSLFNRIQACGTSVVLGAAVTAAVAYFGVRVVLAAGRQQLASVTGYAPVESSAASGKLEAETE